MPRWLARFDTLFARLFLLMWVALVGSHLIAYMAATAHEGITDRHLPVMPSLPPLDTPLLNGLPWLDYEMRPMHKRLGEGPQDEGFEAGEAFHDLTGPGNGHLPPFAPGGRFGPEGPMLWLDYLVRILVIGLFAAAGAYWLAAPIRRLSTASRTLGDALTSGRPAVLLDEDRGTTEVRQASRIFNDMAQRLREQFEGRGLFMAAISHDLRTPLTRLRMRLETMSPEAQAHACVADVREMDALIASVLDLVRGQHGAGEQRRVDLSSLVASVADDFVDMGTCVVVLGAEQPVDSPSDPIQDPATAPSSGTDKSGSILPNSQELQLFVHPQGTKVSATVKVHQPSLRRVLENLVGNAVRYGQQAVIEVVIQDGKVRITIDDRGPGIPDDQLEAVFQPFFRLDASRSRHTGGVGLGLYIARDLLRRDGGELVLVNQSNGGLRATVILPAG